MAVITAWQYKIYADTRGGYSHTVDLNAVGVSVFRNPTKFSLEVLREYSTSLLSVGCMASQVSKRI